MLNHITKIFHYKFNSQIITKQIDEYIEWRKKRWPRGGWDRQRYTLLSFARSANCPDVNELSQKDVDDYLCSFQGSMLRDRTEKIINDFWMHYLPGMRGSVILEDMARKKKPVLSEEARQFFVEHGRRGGKIGGQILKERGPAYFKRIRAAREEKKKVIPTS